MAVPQSSVGLFITESCVITGMSPALKSSISIGDKILEVDGQVVDGKNVLGLLRGNDAVGSKVQLKLRSAAKGHSYSVSLTRQPREENGGNSSSAANSGVHSGVSSQPTIPAPASSTPPILPPQASNNLPYPANPDENARWNMPPQQPPSQHPHAPPPQGANTIPGMPHPYAPPPPGFGFPAGYPGAPQNPYAFGANFPPGFAGGNFPPSPPDGEEGEGDGEMDLEQAIDEIEHLENELQLKDRELDELDDELATAKQDLMLTKIDFQNSDKKLTEMRSLVEGLINDKNKLHLDWQKACETVASSSERVKELESQIKSLKSGGLVSSVSEELRELVTLTIDTNSADWVKSQNRLKMLFRSAAKKMSPEEGEKLLTSVLDENSHDWMQGQAKLKQLYSLLLDITGDSVNHVAASAPLSPSQSQHVKYLETRLGVLEREKREADTQIAELLLSSKENASLHQQLMDTQRQLDAERGKFRVDIQNMRDQLEEMSRVVMRHQGDKKEEDSSARARTQVLENKISELLNLEKTLREEIRGKAGRIEELERRSRDVEDLNAECDMLTSRLKSVETDRNEIQKKYTALVHQNEQYPPMDSQNDRVRALEEQIRTLKAERDVVDAQDRVHQIAERLQAAQDLRRELGETRSRIQLLESQLTSAQEGNKDTDRLKLRIQILEQQLASHQQYKQSAPYSPPQTSSSQREPFDVLSPSKAAMERAEALLNSVRSNTPTLQQHSLHSSNHHSSSTSNYAPSSPTQQPSHTQTSHGQPSTSHSAPHPSHTPSKSTSQSNYGVNPSPARSLSPLTAPSTSSAPPSASKLPYSSTASASATSGYQYSSGVRSTTPQHSQTPSRPSESASRAYTSAYTSPANRLPRSVSPATTSTTPLRPITPTQSTPSYKPASTTSQRGNPNPYPPSSTHGTYSTIPSSTTPQRSQYSAEGYSHTTSSGHRSVTT